MLLPLNDAAAKPAAAKAKKSAEDLEAPAVSHEDPGKVRPGRVQVKLKVVDENPIFAVVFHWRHVGETAYRQMELTGKAPNYVADIDVTGAFEFWVESFDERGNGPGLDGSDAKPIRVELAAAPKPQDNEPPVISHQLPATLQPGRITLSIRIEDASAIFGATLNWRESGEPQWRQVNLNSADGNYAPAIDVTKDFEFWIEAYDEHGNGPANDGTAAAPIMVKLTVATRCLADGYCEEGCTPVDPDCERVAPEPTEFSPLGLTRVRRIQTARAFAAKTIEAQLGGNYAMGSNFLMPGTSMSGMGGNFQAAYGVTDWMSAKLVANFGSTTFKTATGTASAGMGTDLALGARFGSPDFGPLRLGGHALFALPGGKPSFPSNAQGKAGRGLNFELLGAATLEVPHARIHANVGYKFDNSSNLLAGRWPTYAAYGMNVSKYDALGWGLGVEIPFGMVTPFVEYSMDIPVDRRRFATCEGECPPAAPFFPADPWELQQRAGLGARVELMNMLSIDLAAEIGLTPAGTGMDDAKQDVRLRPALDGWAPPAPIAIHLGVTYQYGAPVEPQLVGAGDGAATHDDHHRSEPPPADR